MEKVRIQLLSEFKELFNPNWRYIIYYGGRNSGKSWHAGLSLLLRGRDQKLRILCTREIQKTIKDSVHKLLKDLIEKYEFNDYQVTNDSIVNLVSGTEFFFKGLRQNINEIKSTEGIDICWVEEGQAITNHSLDVLVPTIRKPGSQIIVTFNRFTDLDPIYVRFVMNKTEKTYIKQINYDALEKVGLLSDTIKREIEEDKKFPDKFAHVWLGEPLSQGEFSAIPRDEILKAMQREIEDEGQVEVGVDVARMGEDKTIFWKRKGLKTLNYQALRHKRIPETCDLLESFVDNKEVKLKVDDTGVGGGVSDEMIKRGYNVVAINFGGEPQDKDKYPNLISEAWFYLASIIKNIQLPMDQGLLMELSTRQWKQDIKGRRCIESKKDYKKRGYKSPDMADACIIAYYNPQIIEPDIHFI